MRIQGKEVVEDRVSIRVAGLSRHPAYLDRRYGSLRFRLGQIEAKFVYAEISREWYLLLTDKWPRTFNNTVSFQTTRCQYGGQRLWFECPSCQGRAAVLYQGSGDFRCRKCLNLGYASQKLSYRGLAPHLRHLRIYEESDQDAIFHMRQYYKNKLTRRARRYEKMREQARQAWNALSQKYS